MKRLKYLSFMAIVLLALTGCGKEEVEEKNEVLLLKENLKLEINSEVTLLSLVSEDNKTEIISKDEEVDTSVLGEKELVIAYKENDEEKEYKFKVNVVDTKAPAIECKTELSTNVGTKIDLLKGVKVSDNSKEEIKATVEGDYDINKEGTYNLKYVAVDSSNNKTEEKFTLKVNKPACNLKSGTLTATKPSNLCEYTTIELKWAYLLHAENGWMWVLHRDNEWTNDDWYDYGTEPAGYSKFRPTTKPSLDDENAEMEIDMTIYKIK